MSSVSETLRLHMTFEMRSDWGVGSGLGRSGDVDALIVKDDLDLPMLPAKSITGVLRDACEEVAYALDSGDVGAWHDYLHRLLGDQPALAAGTGGSRFKAPRPAALTIRPGLMADDIRAAVAAERSSHNGFSPLAEAATIVRPNIKIDADSGTTEKGSLRMLERGRAGQTLTADVELHLAALADSDGLDVEGRSGASPAPEIPKDFDKEFVPKGLQDVWKAAPAAAVLLTVATKLLTHIGGDRRRGAGRCEVAWAVADIQDAAGSGSFDTSAGATRRFTFRVECVTPVVASAGVTGNVVQSLDYLPGYLLLPIVAKAVGPQAGQWIAEGKLLVSNATPQADSASSVTDAKPTLPVPASYVVEKGEAEARLASSLNDPTGLTRPVAVRGGWIDPKNPPSSARGIRKVAIQERAHAVIDDDAQHPTEASGGLFAQEAIPAGECYVFDVLAPLERLELPGRARIGRSKKDDYGDVRITGVAKSDVTVKPLGSGPGRDAADDATSTGGGSAGSARDVTVFFTSDCILLDPATLTSVIDPDAVAQHLGDALGLQGVQRSSWERLDVRRHDTWSATWGLPRPSLIAIRAGSVIKLEGAIVDEDEFSRRKEAIEAFGLGERRAEGFGRVLIDSDVLTPAQPTSPAEEHPEETAGDGKNETLPVGSGPPTRPSPASAALEELWKQAVRRWIEEKALDVAIPPDGLRKTLGIDDWRNSQLGLLREAVTGAGGDAKINVNSDRLADQCSGSLKALLNNPKVALKHLGLDAGFDEFAIGARKLLLLHCIQQELRTKRAKAGTSETQPAGSAS